MQSSSFDTNIYVEVIDLILEIALTSREQKTRYCYSNLVEAEAITNLLKVSRRKTFYCGMIDTLEVHYKRLLLCFSNLKVQLSELGVKVFFVLMFFNYSYSFHFVQVTGLQSGISVINLESFDACTIPMLQPFNFQLQCTLSLLQENRYIFSKFCQSQKSSQC